MSKKQQVIDLLSLIEFYGKVVELDDLLSQINYWQNSTQLPLTLGDWTKLKVTGDTVEAIMSNLKAELEKKFGIEGM